MSWLTALAMHHIYCETKKEVIHSVAHSLKLRGLCLVGKPGWVVVIGSKEDVFQFEKTIKRLRWQRIKIMDRRFVEGTDLCPSFEEVGSRLEFEQRMRMHNLNIVLERISSPFGSSVPLPT